MHMRRLLTLTAFGLGAAACADAGPTTPTDTQTIAGPALSSAGGPARATGGGHFDAGVDVTFGFSAVQTGPGMAARGQMRFSTALDGEVIEFHGVTTCMAVDPVEGRAWIGGVITQNNSTHPAFSTEINEPGDDIWFRVLDSGEGADAAADRTTFVGFEGSAGIPTSEAYCEMQIWPDDNARTSPLTQGNVQVK